MERIEFFTSQQMVRTKVHTMQVMRFKIRTEMIKSPRSKLLKSKKKKKIEETT